MNFYLELVVIRGQGHPYYIIVNHFESFINDLHECKNYLNKSVLDDSFKQALKTLVENMEKALPFNLTTLKEDRDVSNLNETWKIENKPLLKQIEKHLEAIQLKREELKNSMGKETLLYFDSFFPQLKG